jgi:hypothetical protein
VSVEKRFKVGGELEKKINTVTGRAVEQMGVILRVAATLFRAPSQRGLPKLVHSRLKW